METLIQYISNPAIILSMDRKVRDVNSSMEVLCRDVGQPPAFFVPQGELSDGIWKSGDSKLSLSARAFHMQFTFGEGYLLLFSKEAVVPSILTEILDVVTDIIMIVDKNGIKRRQNQAAWEFFRSIGETAQLRLNEPISFYGITSAQNPAIRALHTCQTFSMDIVYPHEITITYTCTPALGPDGTVRFVTVTGQDITAILKEEKKLQRMLDAQNRYLDEINRYTVGAGRLLVEDPKMRELVRMAEKVASSNIPVLIEGETGVGKELIANLVHNKSRRSKGPFVAVNCAAIPPNLLEMELFGYERGSFTGARKEGKKGLLSLADGGTVFLDEIVELPPEMQAKLLRAIQDRSFMPLGSTELRRVDVRYIAATNADLERTPAFHKDLYYRLSAVKLQIPPLRERPGDILPLVETFLEEFNQKYYRNILFSSDVEDFFRHYSWPGNVRQLKNIIERIVILADGDMPTLSETKFMMDLCGELEEGDISISGLMPLKDAYKRLDEALVRKAVERQPDLSLMEVAELLDVAPSTLYRKHLDRLLKDK